MDVIVMKGSLKLVVFKGKQSSLASENFLENNNLQFPTMLYGRQCHVERVLPRENIFLFKLELESFYEVEVNLADAIFPNLQKRNLLSFLPSKVETRCCICGLRRAEVETLHTSSFFSGLGLKASFFFCLNGDYWRASLTSL
jgi:hypothetical protein